MYVDKNMENIVSGNTSLEKQLFFSFIEQFPIGSLKVEHVSIEKWDFKVKTV